MTKKVSKEKEPKDEETEEMPSMESSEEEKETTGKKKKEPPYDRQAVWRLANTFFKRGKKGKTAEYRLMGDFTCCNARWRILGMRVSRDDHRTSYDVFRIDLKELGQTDLPRERRQQVLHLCRSDDAGKQKEFLLEYQLLHLLSDVYVNWRQRRHFPELFGCGAFAKLIYRGKDDDDDPITQMPKIPRPFFIVEQLSFTVEELMWMPKYGYLDLQTACYVCIGMIKALRLIHELGFALRDVSPSHFSIRLPPSHLLHRSETELADRIALTAMPCVIKYIHLKRIIPTCGYYVSNNKYSSPAAMELKGQTSVDDLVSVFFIFYEMVIGRLPWTLSSDPATVITMKREMMATDTIKNDKGKVIVSSGFSRLFNTVLSSNPYTFSLNYESLYTQIQKLCTEVKPEFSLFGRSSYNKAAYLERCRETTLDKQTVEETKNKKKKDTTDDETPKDNQKKKSSRERTENESSKKRKDDKKSNRELTRSKENLSNKERISKLSTEKITRSTVEENNKTDKSKQK